MFRQKGGRRVVVCVAAVTGCGEGAATSGRRPLRLTV